ncbi:MAG: hypothetical protein ACE1Y7_12195, partial [Lysobacteraceae bacterium]
APGAVDEPVGSGDDAPRARVDGDGFVLDGALPFVPFAAQADAVLVVGSSLMVYSGFRFVKAAAKAGLPVAALNRGRTRADDLLQFKDERDCAEALASVIEPSAG